MKLEPARFSFGTKAQTLERLAPLVTPCSVPDFTYISIAEWRKSPSEFIDRVADQFSDQTVIVRSSASAEDSADQAMAGLYDSVPHIKAGDPAQIQAAMTQVAESYQKIGGAEDAKDHVLVQVMIRDVLMSGVLFTQDLTTGAPYYVINYDDVTGRTDTVTGGGEYSNRTMYVHRGARSALRSPRFEVLIDAVMELEDVIGSTSLDVEFAVDAELNVHLFQVRQIATQPNWNRHISQRVDDVLPPIQKFVRDRFGPMTGVRGKSSVFGQMPDWNPAEMIGRAPRPLAMSLYRHLITDQAWRVARAQMGYAHPHGQPLMVSLGGQPFIDVRLSFHSYLPADLSDQIGGTLVDAWLDRLVAHPHLHDKVEFQVATTALAFDFDDRIAAEIPGALTADALGNYRQALGALTADLVTGASAPIEAELRKIADLAANRTAVMAGRGPRGLGVVASLLEDCIQNGTTPFSVLARHAFIAQILLLSLIARGVLTSADVQGFLRSIKTVAGEFAEESQGLGDGSISTAQFMEKYGHLRPGTYDILSQRYDHRDDTFVGRETETEAAPAFALSSSQRAEIDHLLAAENFGIGADQLLDYVRQAITGREYGKFVFTRNISDALEEIAAWGASLGLSRAELSFIEVGTVLDQLTASETGGAKRHLREISEDGQKAHETTVALRLPQLLFDEAGTHIIPLQLSQPNFISTETVRGPCVYLTTHDEIPDEISGGIILIESADPGFDWIFGHNIRGLVTKFGGANSH
ncbi:MAG: pyruvate phosphate dikinase, partial [Alphaproteobacteria bacterium]|nr:pyruvate phosphate dikinase [Alphaproteobacteria bacterium]